MLGHCVALLAALSWAGNATILKFLTTKMDAISLNTIRLWSGSFVLLSFVFLSGRGDDCFRIPLQPLLLVIVSGLIALAVGDTIFIKSLTFVDISRAFPIGQCTFLLLTIIVAILFLGESFTLFNIIGAVLVIVGLYFVAVLGDPSKTFSRRRINMMGVILALAASVAWTIGAVTLKLGVTEMDSFVAAAIRIPVSAIAITGLLLRYNRDGITLQFKRNGFLSIAFAGGAGILAYGVGAVGYVIAMQLIGAGRTVLISGVAPIFALPFSILLLKERPTLYAIAGTVICVIGIIMLSI